MFGTIKGEGTGTMWNAIKYNIAHLVDFAGRDDRPTFWWYALFVVILQVLIGITVALPMTLDAVGQSMDAVKAGAEGTDVQGQIIANMASSGQLQTQALVSLVLNLVAIALLAASFVRRLRDAGFAAWIAIAVLASQVYAAVAEYFASLRVVTAMQQALANGDAAAAAAAANDAVVSGVVGWIGLLAGIVLAVMKSKLATADRTEV